MPRSLVIKQSQNENHLTDVPPRASCAPVYTGRILLHGDAMRFVWSPIPRCRSNGISTQST